MFLSRRASLMELQKPQGSSEISTAELRKALEDSSAIVLDARPYEEYAVSHIPGAQTVLRYRFYLLDEPHTRLMNCVHFYHCRGCYSDALQIRFATLSRGAPVDVNLNASLQSVAHNDGAHLW